MSASRPTRLQLKQPTGWFAAGREVELALTLLSDTAFKLFIWLCLHAERSRGTIRIQPPQLASSLGRGQREIEDAMDELLRQGVCDRGFDDTIKIADRFWPYERIRHANDNELAVYIGKVKQLFLQRRCVRSTFTAADEKLATQLYRDGISIRDVDRAILLGAVRKYVTLLNNRHGTPITCLHYFTALFDEVRREISTEYWAYVAQKVRTLEQRWSGFCVADQSSRSETK